MDQTQQLKRLSEVIRTDATTVGEADFLATHTPFQQLGFTSSGTDLSQQIRVNEEEMFHNYLVRRLPEHQLIAVQGDNGSGKSHFIRWVKEKFRRIPELNDEAFIFISRHQSTLRGALEQIIRSNVIESTKLQEIEKLVKANEHLSADELKQDIILQFAIASNQDLLDGGKIVSKWLDKRYHKNIYPFLTNQVIQELLFREKGPVSRILTRLAGDNDNRRVDDVIPRFIPEDFAFDFAKLTEVRHTMDSRNALRIAEDLIRDAVLREKFALYLNEFLETVVQKCTNLRATDLRNIFNELRIELKKQGKGLMLFIEDITSFTGIDRALVEVLITENKGDELRESFCRIYSIVGITNDYYQNSLPDNLKERLTGRIFIDQAFLTKVDEVADLAGRYLNAVFVQPSEIEYWINNGGNQDKLPVARTFFQHDWALHTLSEKIEVSLFPFNKQALWNIYNGLNDKSPRLFLTSLKLLLQKYFTLSPRKLFPPPLIELGLEFKVPNWSAPQHEQRLARTGEADRLITFVRLWGDGSLYERIGHDGEKLVGGLSTEAYHAFQLPCPNGVPDGNTSKSTGQFVTPGPTTDFTNGDIEKERESKAEAESVKVEPGEKIVFIPSNDSPSENKEYDAFKSAIEEWIQGKTLSLKELRTDIHKMLLDFIDWETEGVPALLVNSLFVESKIDIEDFFYQAKGQTITIKRGMDTKMAFMAIGAWRHLGNQSWDFPEATDHLAILFSWMNKMKSAVLIFMQESSGDANLNYDTLGLYSVCTSFYSHLLVGHIKHDHVIGAQPQTLYPILLQSLQKGSPIQPCSKEWEGLYTQWYDRWELIIEQQNTIKRYFNCIQGDPSNAEKAVPVYFLDAANILRYIKNLQSNNWQIEVPKHLKLERMERNIWLNASTLLVVLQNVLPTAITQEKVYVKKVLENLLGYLGDGNMYEVLPVLWREMVSILKFFREKRIGYRSQTLQVLENETFDISHWQLALNRLQELANETDPVRQMLGIINEPRQPLHELFQIVKEFDSLLESKATEYQNRLGNATLGQVSEAIDQSLREAESRLVDLLQYVDELTGEVEHASAKNIKHP